jgi:serine protease AprX
MWRDSNLLIVWAAGNDGERDCTKAGSTVYREVGEEAAAKNPIVVGATFNARYMLKQGNHISDDFCMDGRVIRNTATNRKRQGYQDSADSLYRYPLTSDMAPTSRVAIFSSRGPTVENRLKPDVVAPGTGILSALSRSATAKLSAIRNEFQGFCENQDAGFLVGSSQAAPIVAGCAAVLREALASNGLPVASGPLIKALLINGAVDLSGENYRLVITGKVDKEFSMPAAPNPVQGFGRVNIERSLVSVVPSDPLRGGYADIPAIGQGQTHSYDFSLDPVLGMPTLYVTLAYNDAPGVIMGNILKLSVVSLTKNDIVRAVRQPDPIQTMDYEKKNIECSHNNAQRVTWPRCPGGKLQIRVYAEVTWRPMARVPFSICWSFL